MPKKNKGKKIKKKQMKRTAKQDIEDLVKRYTGDRYSSLDCVSGGLYATEFITSAFSEPVKDTGVSFMDVREVLPDDIPFNPMVGWHKFISNPCRFGQMLEVTDGVNYGKIIHTDEYYTADHPTFIPVNNSCYVNNPIFELLAKAMISNHHMNDEGINDMGAIIPTDDLLSDDNCEEYHTNLGIVKIYTYQSKVLPHLKDRKMLLVDKRYIDITNGWVKSGLPMGEYLSSIVRKSDRFIISDPLYIVTK